MTRPEEQCATCRVKLADCSDPVSHRHKDAVQALYTLIMDTTSSISSSVGYRARLSKDITRMHCVNVVDTFTELQRSLQTKEDT